MAIDGARANLGPESSDWVQKLELKLAEANKRIVELEKMIRAVLR